MDKLGTEMIENPEMVNIEEPQQTVHSIKEECITCGESLGSQVNISGKRTFQCVQSRGEQAEVIGEELTRGQKYNGRNVKEPICNVGEVEFFGFGKKHGKFVRVSCHTPPAAIFDLLTGDWNLPAPNLVVSIVGGEENVLMKPWLRDTIRKGLVKAAQSTGAWIITSGLRAGITKHIGEAVRDHALANTCSKIKVFAIGISPWRIISDCEALASVKKHCPAIYQVEETTQGPLYSLDNNHSHFILVDDATPSGTTTLWLKLLKHISEQRTGYAGTGSIEIPVLCVLVHGHPELLQKVYQGMENSVPWLVLAGSGGIADVIASLMHGPLVPDTVQEQLQEKFPRETFSKENILKWTELIQNIMAKDHILTVHNSEQESSEDLDTIMLKALVKACKSQTQEAQEYLDELKLAVAWNRVDIAKSEIFNGDVEWKSCDLEEVMMDALVNDKPEFVRLFIDNGMNMYDFLTYGQLQELYRSISRKSLLYELLLKKHEEQRLTITGMNPTSHRDTPEKRPKFTLYEVSKVLKDFLHDACKGIFQESNPSRKHLGVKKSITELNSKLRGQRLFVMPDLSQKLENPWRDLFLWAILQNRQEMANYFWEMGPEAVPAALAACKILKEMAHLESDTETSQSMKKAKYDQLALDLFGQCYTNSEDRAFYLLIRKTKYWSKTTCLQLATEADAKSFFAHDGVQALLTKIWWGDMSTDTPIWKLLCGFWCPPLIFTNLITFSAHFPSIGKSEQLKELDSLDTEKAFLLSDEANSDHEPKDKKRLCGGNQRREFILRRWKKFWGAPVTVFLGNVILYFAFLSLFAYILLVDFKPPPPIGPSMAEITLYFWVFTLALEELRQSFFTEGNTNIVKKFKLYVEDSWNKCDMVALVLFIVGVTCRMLSVSYNAGRTTLCLDFMVFALRLIHIFAINKQLGPKIIIVERMMKDVFFFLFFLSVWLIAYGVATQALLHPNESRVDWIFRNVLYRPYLQIFGQIPLDEIDEVRMVNRSCFTNQANMTNEANLPYCINRYANWLVIMLLVIFLLVTNVLLLNLLIAMFSYTFQLVQGNTDIFWKFQRYNLIVEYHSRPALAPPFIIISHFNLLIRKIIKEPQHKQEHFEKHLPETLDQKLRIWESVQKENYLANLEKGKKESSTERLKKTSTKVDSLLKSISGLQEQEKRLITLETRMKYCSDVLSWMIECFTQHNMHCSRPPPTYTDSPTPVYKKQPLNTPSADDCPADMTPIAMQYIDE
ncbi:transient receptor potential cation channel subfamily M member 5 isoform X1 [Stegostoma tigrinum]|uniref:transient receptor potential cation channel subfamily M member 5 isoform X1 n=2 Tax=Stegostoma tigrinum TaxID=3053191 RepID=UPI00202ADBF1|nr:transient receptor potential cation channel subfamily M member 5 isoform X1 [Stegostoma tigrinum]